MPTRDRMLSGRVIGELQALLASLHGSASLRWPLHRHPRGQQLAFGQAQTQESDKPAGPAGQLGRPEGHRDSTPPHQRIRKFLKVRGRGSNL